MQIAQSSLINAMTAMCTSCNGYKGARGGQGSLVQWVTHELTFEEKWELARWKWSGGEKKEYFQCRNVMSKSREA
jgi:hypothetical protein